MDANLEKGRVLPVMEHFYTLQGEGCYAGQAAYFIRLAGCDVRCPWCDVKESWTASKSQLVDLEGLVARIPTQVPMAVVTGGGPLLHPLDYLTRALQARGMRTHIETSGSRALSGRWDWVCVSPKEAKEPLDEVLAVASELKMVISRPEDFDRAEYYAGKVPAACVKLLQAEWDRREEVAPLMTEYVKAHPHWRVSVQTHKHLNIP